MRSGILSRSRHVFCLIALLWAVSGFAADVPRETLERLAEVNVALAEIRQLNSIGKLTNAEYNQRKKILDAEQRTLWEPHHLTSQITPQEMQAAQTTLIGLTRTKLSLLEPRWQKEQTEFQEAGRRKHQETAAAVEKDARTAAEFQRQRLLLQRQLDKATIDRDSFAAKDKEAQDSIAALRKKYEDAGGGWPQRFDDHLTLLTKALADTPDTVQPQVTATVEPRPADKATDKERDKEPDKRPDKEAGRGGGFDFDGDVKRAAELLVKYDEMRWKMEKKEVTAATFSATAGAASRDLSRLRARYQSLNQLQQFETAYTRMAEAGLQALRVKYQPEKYRPAAPRPAPPPPETDYTLWYWVGGGILVFLIIGWAAGLGGEPQAPPKPTTSDIHGSAQWAAPLTTPPIAMSVQKGVTFGKSSHPEIAATARGVPVTSLPESHTLIVARTRAGKGTRVIMPTLLRYRDSMLVIDPKGENAAVTGRTRRDSLGHKVHILNPWGELAQHYADLGFSSATYNPLDALDRNDPNVVAIAQNFATTICPTPPDTRDPFWSRSAANILTAVLLWITDRPDEQKTLARVREIVTVSRKEFKKAYMAKMLKSTAFGGAIRELVGQYHDLADETYGSIATHVIESTKFISDPQIKTSTAASSFSANDILDEYMTVFLVIPHDRIETHATWLRLVIASAMQAIKKRARITPPRHHRCMFLIDEFGSIGHMTGLPQDIAIMAGYGLDFTLIVQGLDQLKHHYGEASKTILGNCGYKWFSYIADLDTAKWLSETLGKKTVATSTTSKSTGTSGQHPTEGESTTHAETGRALLNPDEILNLGRDVAILLNPSTPQYLRPVDYWYLTRDYAYLQNSHASLYWKPPLSYDDNPYVKSSQPFHKQMEALFGKNPVFQPPPNPSPPSKLFDPNNPFGR